MPGLVGPPFPVPRSVSQVVWGGRDAYGVERRSVSCRGLVRDMRAIGRLLTSSHDSRCSWVDRVFLITKTARRSMDSPLTLSGLTAHDSAASRVKTSIESQEALRKIVK
jgi:hypothetical protein